jgi:folate-binding protein YgfZ
LSQGLKALMSQLFVIRLEHLSVLRFRGADASRFLQGQLSCDVQRLARVPSVLGGLHDPQGRVLALLRLVALENDDILAVLPRELAATVQAHLRRYVLRAKVTIDVADAEWHAIGLCGPDANAAARLHKPIVLSNEPSRLMLIASRHEPLPEGDALEAQEWQALDVADGLPEVFTATSGLFVSQMLNLDLLDGISFEKGCYTGQEIVARAHWRGKVKRRIQRFATETPRSLAPGERIVLADGRAAQIVRQARFGQVGSEFLAVAPLPEEPEGSPQDAAAEGDRLQATPLSMPYELPD